MVKEYKVLSNIQKYITNQNHQFKKILPPMFFCYRTNTIKKFVLNPITKENSEYHIINICSTDTYKYINLIEFDELFYIYNLMEEAEEIVEYIINNPKNYLLKDDEDTIVDNDLIYKL